MYSDRVKLFVSVANEQMQWNAVTNGRATDSLRGTGGCVHNETELQAWASVLAKPLIRIMRAVRWAVYRIECGGSYGFRIKTVLHWKSKAVGK